MIELLLLISLGVTSQPPVMTADINPCVWPNKCAVETVTASINTCVWPNVCAEESIGTCQFPNTCG
jgi:hypothetical protein